MTIQDPDLACNKVVEMVTDYLEGALATQDAEQLEQHLLICDACCTFVDQHRTVIKTLARVQITAPQQEPAQDARSAALDLFRRMRKGTRDDGGQP